MTRWGRWGLEYIGPTGLRYPSTLRFWTRSGAALAAARLAPIDGWSIEVVPWRSC